MRKLLIAAAAMAALAAVPAAAQVVAETGGQSVVSSGAAGVTMGNGLAGAYGASANQSAAQAGANTGLSFTGPGLTITRFNNANGASASQGSNVHIQGSLGNAATVAGSQQSGGASFFSRARRP